MTTVTGLELVCTINTPLAFYS